MPSPGPRRLTPLALPAVAAGLVWLAWAAEWTWWIGLAPAALLLASGLSLALWPGEHKITQYMALGAVLSVVATLLASPGLGVALSVLNLGLAVGSYLAAGRAAIGYAGTPPTVPLPKQAWAVDAKVALDEALVGYFVLGAALPGGESAAAACEDLERIERWSVAAEKGNAAQFNEAPSAPEDVVLRSQRSAGHVFDEVTFDSGYQPHPGAPARPEWLVATANRQCRLRVFRASRPDRPWVVGIHGYRMGLDWLDTRLFRPDTWVGKLDYNLVLPTLPLHGARKVGRRSGDHFLDSALSGLLYAEAQALWDLRRCLAWIRGEVADARIGVVGYSLGGYNAALLAAHDASLDYVVAGIPVADFAPMLWNHLPPAHRQYFASHGVDIDRYRRLLAPVSPLQRAPEIARERLAIFAGSVDRVVPPQQPLALAAHWNVPVRWYGGGHLTFRGERAVTDTLRSAAQAAGWMAHSSSSAVSARETLAS